MPDHDLRASILGPARILLANDAGYPAELRDLESPPSRLFVVGAICSFEHAVAIVGTRRASADGRSLAREIARALTLEDCLVVSGAAEGIDGEAHTGALEAPGPTLAVIATPLDAPYPVGHVPLLEAVIAGGGAVVSETAPGTATFPSSFLRRNRLVAALARAVVVIEAPARSGTLSTVKHARALGRPIFAVPWSPLEPQRAGGVELLARGVARAVRDAADILAALEWRRESGRRTRAVQCPSMNIDGALSGVVSRAEARDTGESSVDSSTGFQCPSIDIDGALSGVVSRAKARDTGESSVDLSTGFQRPHASVRAADSNEARVLSAVALGADVVDAIVRETGLEAAVVSSTLFTLVLDGAVTQSANRHRVAR